MKEDFLRRPATGAEWTADTLRTVAVLSVVIAAIWLKPTDAGIAALAVPAIMLPRMLAVRPWFDVAACITLLVAAWSNVFGLYESVPGWDLLLHFACTGMLAILAALVLTRTGVVAITGRPVRARTPLLLLPMIALAIGALWEMVEWMGFTYVSDDIVVTYQDTIGDMLFGGIGGAAAGILLAVTGIGRVTRAPSHHVDHMRAASPADGHSE